MDLGGIKRGHYQCILADPPWQFKTWSGKKMTPHRTANDHYTTMSRQEISELPVGQIAAQNCALFMWIVSSHLDQAIDLARMWGFQFKTVAFIWLKETNGGAQLDIFNGESEPRISMGYWTRKQTEICLLFTKGAPKRLAKGIREIIRDRRREHSRKPDEQYARIEALVAGPRIELFARQTRPGWRAWGLETDKFKGD